MAKSIRTRIFRGVAAVSIVTTGLMFAAVFFAYQDLERVMLKLAFAEEQSHFLAHLDHRQGNILETGNLTAAFVPDAAVVQPPSLFSSLPIPYSGELQRGSRHYLVLIDEVSDGTLYLAREVSLFEHRERHFRKVLIVIALLAAAMGLLLAGLIAGRIARPMSRLAQAIAGLSSEKATATGRDFPTDFHEAELQAIALAFARYLDELDAQTRRERRLLGLASHELRTPVAVIAGALDVVDKVSGIDDPRQQRALKRIRLATDEMREQLAAILSLSRKADPDVPSPTDLGSVVSTVIDDMAVTSFPVERLSWESPSAPVIAPADPVLAKMLIRNLLQNALQHTTAENVVVRLEARALSVSDNGPGLPATYKVLLDGASSQAPGGAVGLYLVTLIAERLGWSLSTDETPGGGTHIALAWESPEPSVQPLPGTPS